MASNHIKEAIYKQIDTSYMNNTYNVVLILFCVARMVTQVNSLTSGLVAKSFK